MSQEQSDLGFNEEKEGIMHDRREGKVNVENIRTTDKGRIEGFIWSRLLGMNKESQIETRKKEKFMERNK